MCEIRRFFIKPTFNLESRRYIIINDTMYNFRASGFRPTGFRPTVFRPSDFRPRGFRPRGFRPSVFVLADSSSYRLSSQRPATIYNHMDYYQQL